MKWLASIAIGILLLGNILFIYTTVQWRKEALNLRKQNAQLDSQKRTAEHSAEAARESLQAASTVQAIAGLYEFKDPNVNNQGYQELDLRSDGSGTFDQGFGGRPRKLRWEKNGASAIIVQSFGDMKIENGDLIDHRGNRWLHIR